MRDKNLIKKSMIFGLVVVGIALMLSGNVNAYNKEGNGCCGCDSCRDCMDALNDDKWCYRTVRIYGDITNNIKTIGTQRGCIGNPENFKGKTFDCQGHTMHGNSSEPDGGIVLNHRGQNTIKNCIITGFDFGIFLYDSRSNNIINNTIYSNDYYGIVLRSSSYNTITNNNIYSNWWGIYLNYSSSNTFNTNKICDNYIYSFYISDSPSNYGSNNTCNSGWNDMGIEKGCAYRCDGTVCDADKDYYVKVYSCGGTDCNDNNANIHPNATEICNGIDDNCNYQTDEGLQQYTYFRDADSDNYGSKTNNITTCNATIPAGYITNNTDCNDNNNQMHPGATEICDGNDNNCNNQTDEGFTQYSYFRDADNDNYGSKTNNITTCNATIPAGYIADNSDCNDNNAGINPSATEIYYDGVDNDCNTLTKDCDKDNDGFNRMGGICDGTDCNDSNAIINPSTVWFYDADNDGYGNATNYIISCDKPSENYVLYDLGLDCDDNNDSITDECCTKFDFDNNTAIDIFDVVAALEYLSEGKQIYNTICSEANGNGRIDLIDVIALIDKIVIG